MDLDAFFAENPMGGMDAYGSDAGFRSGFVTLVGRPNAGKSTLINAIMGKKIAITSSTAQTTRHRLSAVLSLDDAQIILVDTPGLHKPKDALGSELNAAAISTLDDVDVIAMLIDSSEPIGKGDRWVAEQLGRVSSPKICVLSKIDLVDQEMLADQVSKLKDLADWSAVIALSAKSGYNVDAFLEEVVGLLPQGPAWFPRDMECDQPIETMVAEFIREKILRDFRDEVPHAVGVQTDEMEYVSKKKLYRIYATIYVERDSQKGILIGKGGTAIKQIGTKARRDLELLLGTKVFLDLKVKVKHNWRSDESQIRRLGYIDR